MSELEQSHVVCYGLLPTRIDLYIHAINMLVYIPGACSYGTTACMVKMQELKLQDDQYVKYLKKQAEEVDLILERMEEQACTLLRAHRQEMRQIESSFATEREALRDSHKSVIHMYMYMYMYCIYLCIFMYYANTNEGYIEVHVHVHLYCVYAFASNTIHFV